MWSQGAPSRHCRRLCPAQTAGTEVAGGAGSANPASLCLPSCGHWCKTVHLGSFFLFVQKCHLSLAVDLHGLSPHPRCPPSELSVILHPAPSSCPLLPGLGATDAAQPLQGGRVCPSSCWHQASLHRPAHGIWQERGGKEGGTPCLGFSPVSVPSLPSLHFQQLPKEVLSLWQG